MLAQLSSPLFTGSWDLSASQTPGCVDGFYVRVDILRRVSGLPGVLQPRITLVYLTEKALAVVGGTVAGGSRVQGHFTSGGSDIRIASTLPPVFRPKIVPRSCSRLYST